MEPPLLYLHSLGIVSDEINATHEIRLRKLRDRDVLVNGSQCEQRCAYAALPPAFLLPTRVQSRSNGTRKCEPGRTRGAIEFQVSQIITRLGCNAAVRVNPGVLANYTRTV